MGTFALPLSARLEGEEIRLRQVGPHQVGRAILFENREGSVGYESVAVEAGRDAALARPAPGQDVEWLRRDLEELLVAEGLYEKEARAMIATWDESWFEEGLRVLYVVPRAVTDAVLPLAIAPEPAETVRVLVGRIEILTPEMETAVEDALARLGDPSAEIREAARREVGRHRRFTETILQRILARPESRGIRTRIAQELRRLRSARATSVNAGIGGARTVSEPQ